MHSHGHSARLRSRGHFAEEQKPVMNGATVVLFSQSAAEGVNSCVRNTLGTSAPDRLANEAASVGRSLPHGAAVA
jgi:hypothetical protein